MSDIHTHHLQVQGITCQHCVKAITQAIQACDAGARVAVDLPAGSVEANTSLPLEAVRRAIEEEGYTVLA